MLFFSYCSHLWTICDSVAFTWSEIAGLLPCHCLFFISSGTMYYILCNGILTPYGKAILIIFWKFYESSPLHFVPCKVTGLFYYSSYTVHKLKSITRKYCCTYGTAYSSLSSTDIDTALQLNCYKHTTTIFLKEQLAKQIQTFWIAWFCKTLAVNGLLNLTGNMELFTSIATIHLNLLIYRITVIINVVAVKVYLALLKTNQIWNWT